MRAQRLLNSPWFAITAPAAAGLGCVAFIVRGLKDYDWSLFLGLPFVVSFLAAFCHSFRREVKLHAAFRMAALSMLLVGAAVLVAAIDGLICLLMALPLALGIGAIGALAGWQTGRVKKAAGPKLPLLVVGLLPLLATLEHATKPPPALRMVMTRVVIDAPPSRVWPAVIAFPQITEPPCGIFRLGIAYPVEARIEGAGVGAMRHCVFSTGSFVEPITAWEAPSRLAFAVTAQPEPMREFSIYKHIDAPHLHGFMVSERGQFRLVEAQGRTVLEGTTWYRHDLAPGWYWGPITDTIIHHIHARVLTHIRRTVEAR